MHSPIQSHPTQTRFVTLLDVRPHGGEAASVRATNALLVRPGKRKSTALTARLDAVKRHMLGLI